MDLVDPELRKRYRFMGSVPVGSRWIVKLTRLAMPLAPKVKVPADVRLEVIRNGRIDGVRVYTPSAIVTAVGPVALCCGSTVAE